MDAKTLLAFRIREILDRRETSLEEAEMVSREILEFIDGRLFSRCLGLLSFPPPDYVVYFSY